MTESDPKEAFGRKPAVLLFLCGPVLDHVLSSILWGMEEEGIPSKTHEALEGAAESLAREAAYASALNVGIGINGRDSKIALHHRDLGQRGPLIALDLSEADVGRLRHLGANAARLVKGNSLLFETEDGRSPVPGKAGCHALLNLPEADLLEVVCRVVMELLTDEAKQSHGDTKSWSH